LRQQGSRIAPASGFEPPGLLSAARGFTTAHWARWPSGWLAERGRALACRIGATRDEKTRDARESFLGGEAKWVKQIFQSQCLESHRPPFPIFNKGREAWTPLRSRSLPRMIPPHTNPVAREAPLATEERFEHFGLGCSSFGWSGRLGAKCGSCPGYDTAGPNRLGGHCRPP
jgi:hypothetical protein